MDTLMTNARARYGALTGFVATCRDVGVDPLATMRAHHLDPARLDDLDAWAPAIDVVRTLESAAVISGCGSIGVRMARLRTLAAVGPLSLVLTDEPTFRDSLDLLGRFWPSYNEALRLSLDIGPTFTRVIVTFDLPAGEQYTQAVELSLGVVTSLARARSTPANPLDVSFRHPAPADGVDHQRSFFDTHLSYASGSDAITFATGDLDLVTHQADPVHRELVMRFLADFTAVDQDLTDQVRRLVADLLPTGRCSAQRIASTLHMTQRTLHRRLSAHGTGFSQIVQERREEACRRLLARHEAALTEIAEALGFVTLSSFSRWFTATFGMSASAWRRRQR